MNFPLPLWLGHFTVLLVLAGFSFPQLPLLHAATATTSSLHHARGEMAGEPTQTAILLQSRLTATANLVDGDLPGAPGVARFEMDSNPAFENPVRTPWLHARPDSDFILKTKATGLLPGTQYHYRLVFGPDTNTLQTGPARSFRTLPSTDAVTKVRFIIGNCMNYAFFHEGKDGQGLDPATRAERRPGYPAMETILRLAPDFFIGAGDNVYYDHFVETRARTQPELRRKWHEQFAQPRLVALFGSVASYWLKDDHDYRINDSDPTGDYQPSHELGIATFREQMPVVDPTDPDAVTYRTHRVNRLLQLWMVEGRDYRSPNAQPDGPRKSIWGERQKAWLQRTLLESEAPIKILVSPTPMIGPDDASKRDNHTNPGGFRHEGDAFFQWLADHAVTNFFILCGDRHWQYHSIHPTGYEEFACGALNDENSRPGRKPGDPNSTDPNATIRQPYTYPEPTGGFLQVSVAPEPDGGAVGLVFRFYDEHGTELHTDERQIPINSP